VHQPTDSTVGSAQTPVPQTVQTAGTTAAVPAQAAFGLSAEETDILSMLLAGENPASYIRAHHLYPAVVADSINEKLFDEIGDSAVEEEDGSLSLIEDYRSDLRALLPQ
jgi:hypothetical protein